MLNFYKQRPFLENEFEEAEWIPESGLNEDALSDGFHAYLVENQNMEPPLLRAGGAAVSSGKLPDFH